MTPAPPMCQPWLRLRVPARRLGRHALSQPSALRAAARSAGQAGRTLEAVALLERAAQLRPRDPVLPLALAEAHLQAGDAAACRRWAGAAGRSPAGMRLIAEAAAAEGDPGAEATAWAALLRAWPADLHARARLAEALLQGGRLGAAEAQLYAAHRQDRGDPQVAQGLADLALIEGEPGVAGAWLRRAQAARRGTARFAEQVAQVQLMRGSPDVALRALEGLPGPRAVELRVEAALAGGAVDRAARFALGGPARARAAVALADGDARAAIAAAREGLGVARGALERGHLLHLEGEGWELLGDEGRAAAAFTAGNAAWGPPADPRAFSDRVAGWLRARPLRPVRLSLPRADAARLVVLAGPPGAGARLLGRLLAADGAAQEKSRGISLSALAEEIERRSRMPWREALPLWDRAGLADLLHRYLGPAGGPPGLLIDASPRNAEFLEILDAIAPDARVVALARGLDDLALSAWRRPAPARGFAWSRSLPGARAWLEAHAAWMSGLPHRVGLELLPLSYEGLVVDPERSLAGLAGRLGLGAAPLERWIARAPALPGASPGLSTARVGRGGAYLAGGRHARAA